MGTTLLSPCYFYLESVIETLPDHQPRLRCHVVERLHVLIAAPLINMFESHQIRDFAYVALVRYGTSYLENALCTGKYTSVK